MNEPKLQVIWGIGQELDEIIGIAPWRDKIVIATRRHVMLMSHDEEMTAKLEVLAQTHARDWW